MGRLHSTFRSPDILQKLEVQAHVSVPKTQNIPMRVLLNEEAFVSMLYLERRRAERSHKRFLLVLMDLKKVLGKQPKDRVVSAMTEALGGATRETDILGWYIQGEFLGLVATELGNAGNEVIQSRLLSKIRSAFERVFGRTNLPSISLSFHFFPEEPSRNADHSPNITLYPDLTQKKKSNWFALGVKRAIDVMGSLLAMLAFSVVFVAIAMAIKLTSKGSVLFRQERLGQGGQKFEFLKFRSMYVNTDTQIHQQYVQQFISGQVAPKDGTGEETVFKIKNDPRVTAIGQFIRRTSLDELPQFWNVLMGEMSLVGPRPPLPYEYDAYSTWHRRRVLEIKPGMTGLWQVKGRSRTQFDEMVRLDLKYARSWSNWLDLKILLQTPRAVVSGNGAH